MRMCEMKIQLSRGPESVQHIPISCTVTQNKIPYATITAATLVPAWACWG